MKFGKTILALFILLTCLFLTSGCAQLAAVGTEEGWDVTPFSCETKQDCINILEQNDKSVNLDWVKCSFNKCVFFVGEVESEPAKVAGEEIR